MCNSCCLYPTARLGETSFTNLTDEQHEYPTAHALHFDATHSTSLPAHERGTFAILDVAKTQFRAVTKHGLQFGETGNKRRELMAVWLKFKNEPLTEQSSQKRCDEYVDHLVVRDE